jgi:NADPH:quinone reductase-like Zn-dependent oxidoreductase
MQFRCGAEVTGVISTLNLDLVRSLGDDHLIDYTTTDFLDRGRRYDFILDALIIATAVVVGTTGSTNLSGTQ